MVFRLHCLGIPHTVTSKEYLPCAFAQKVLKFCQMMSNLGHEVIHYGNEASEVVCSEHVTVSTLADLDKTYGDRNYWKTAGFDTSMESHVFKEFTRNTIRELVSRIQPNDFLLCFWGTGHTEIAQSINADKVFVVEPVIGYTYTFAPYRVFESYAKMHLQRGILHGKEQEYYTQVNWNYDVIPNYFDPDDFEYRTDKEDYLCYIGRLMPNKGIELAMRLADYADMPLKLASHTDPKEFKNIMGWDPYDCIDFVGMADIELRKELMSHAKVGMCPSLYIEPFCGTHIEFGLSGTPVLTTDFGVFTETVLQGENGWRCMSFEEFVYGFDNLDSIKPERCRELAMQYSLDRVSLMYHHYFNRIFDNRNKFFWDVSIDGIPDMNMKKEMLSESEISQQILEIQEQNGVKAKKKELTPGKVISPTKKLSTKGLHNSGYSVLHSEQKPVEINSKDSESFDYLSVSRSSPLDHISSLKKIPKRNDMIFHVLAPPHTITSKDYLICAITQNVLKFCQMMSDRGHHVIHYGNEASEVQARDHVTVMDLEDLKKTYGDTDYWQHEQMHLPRDSHCWKVYHERIVPAIINQVKSNLHAHNFLLFFQTDAQWILTEE